jgi:type IV secretion system protein VirB5
MAESHPTDWAPVAPTEMTETRRRYLERYGSTMVTNAYLRIALFCLSLVCLGVIFVHVRIVQTIHRLQPIVIRINDVGKAEAINYDTTTYRPQALEIRYFLGVFIREHYARLRATIKEDFPNSLLFLDPALAAPFLHDPARRATIEAFLANSLDSEIDVEIHNIALEDIRESPFKATADFTLVYTQPGLLTEPKRERYSGSFIFSFRTSVPNDLVQHNPLGLQISYYRADQAFR